MSSYAEGYRASKTVEGETTKFYWDRGYTINESDGTDFTASNTVGADEIVARQTAAATTYLVKDIHGDTIMTLNTNGTQNAAYDYYTYGEQWSHVGSQDNPYRYCGEYVDNETGFIYLRNRYYDPKLGRFTSEDAYWNPGNMIYGDNGTVGFPDFAAIMQSSNLYAYCMNNPVNFIDPWGQVAWEKFRTLQELSSDWTWNYYSTSDYIMMEQGSLIYQGTDEEGTYYSYTEAIVGTPHTIDFNKALPMIPKNTTYIGAIHSHPMSDGTYSDNDETYISSNDKFLLIAYFNPDDGHINVKFNNGVQDIIIAQNVPISSLSDERKEYLKALSQYERIWYAHITDNCRYKGSKCGLKSWPRTQ